MIVSKASRLSMLVAAVALLVCSGQRQAVFAQAKPETPPAPAQNQPGGTQQPVTPTPTLTQQRPASAQPAMSVQPVPVSLPPGGPQVPAPAKPQMGPPDPSRVPVLQPGTAAHAQPAIPEPTVQLKPGEIPAVKFDVPDYDFGKISAGQEVLHDFWFTNTGNGPLEILSVKPS